MDLHLNGYAVADEAVAQKAHFRYQALLDEIRRLPGSLNLAAEIPGSFELAYTNEHRRFIARDWHVTIENAPGWLTEWARARDAMHAGDSPLALTHFKAALEQAKYAAGPLFMPFYIQVCAFCKNQYKLLSARNKVELFDRFYEILGKSASNYANLMGYTPQSVRDPKTLMPHTMLPLKTRWIISEIDAYARSLRTLINCITFHGRVLRRYDISSNCITEPESDATHSDPARRLKMSKGGGNGGGRSGGSQGGRGKAGGSTGGGRGQGNGGGWPSGTGNPFGGGRSNAPTGGGTK